MFKDLKNYFKKINKNYQAEYLLALEYSFFKTQGKILDVGCGEGNFIKINPKRVIGIDTNKKSIAACKKKQLHAVFGSAVKIPFKNSSFYGVHASHIIEHLLPDEAMNFLKEVDRVLKKDGVFVISTPLLWKGFYNDFTHVKPYNPESILRYMVQEGFEKTLSSFVGKYDCVNLIYRYNQLPLPGKLGKLISNYLYTFNIHTLSKNGYMLILRKK